MLEGTGILMAVQCTLLINFLIINSEKLIFLSGILRMLVGVGFNENCFVFFLNDWIFGYNFNGKRFSIHFGRGEAK